MRTLSFSFIAALLMCGCATKSGYQKMEDRNATSKARHAAYAAEGFYTYNTPEREVTNWQFYYKNCLLEGQSDYPKKTEYACNDPY